MNFFLLLLIAFIFQLQYRPPYVPGALPYLQAGHHRQHTAAVSEWHSEAPRSFLSDFATEYSYPYHHSTSGISEP